MEFVILLLIYILSAIAWHLSIRYMYTYQFKNISPGYFELIITFIPLVNTLWAFFSWVSILIDISSKNTPKKKNTVNKFFGIKR